MARKSKYIPGTIPHAFKQTHKLRRAVYCLLQSPALDARLDSITKHNLKKVRDALKETGHISTLARKL